MNLVVKEYFKNNSENSFRAKLELISWNKNGRRYNIGDILKEETRYIRKVG